MRHAWMAYQNLSDGFTTAPHQKGESALGKNVSVNHHLDYTNPSS